MALPSIKSDFFRQDNPNQSRYYVAMNTSYIPIACSLHDGYEIAIMKKSRINIKWITESGDLRHEAVLPIDLLVKNKEEFLVVVDQSDNELRIRLDKITLLS